jgi:hypothetical protein
VGITTDLTDRALYEAGRLPTILLIDTALQVEVHSQRLPRHFATRPIGCVGRLKAGRSNAAIIAISVAACAATPETGQGAKENTGTLVGAVAGLAGSIVAALERCPRSTRILQHVLLR